MSYRPQIDPETNAKYVTCPFKGRDLLSRSLWSKDSAFTQAERDVFGLEGLLPPAESSLESQLERVYANYQDQSSDLDRYVYLAALMDRNETLFYRLVLDHLSEMVPMIYTPVVAEGCRNFSKIYRQGRGLYVSINDRGRVAEVLKNYPLEQPDIIVVTDNERILGIGDQGVGGMGIPVGKLSLYVVTAGFHPGKTLPISLDVGTNNQELLSDPLYLGVREPRKRGDEYHDFVEEFTVAVQEVWPGTLLQWEDFGKSTAMVHLNKYRDKFLTFNDDIQGTAAVVDAGLRAAADHLGKPLQEMNIVMHGAGSAGIGIATELEEAMVQAGASREDAHSRFVVLDSRGVVFSDRDRLEDEKAPFASAPDRFAGKVERDADGRISLEQLCDGWQIDVLLGVSGQPGVFHEEVVKAVAAKTDRPIIMPLSNPTANAEATPENLFKWTDGKCLVATGSPFAPCNVNGREVAIGQGNNMFIFPGVGLGAVLTKASTVTMGMFLASAQAVRECLPQDRLDNGTLYPDITDARKVARAVAVAVGAAAHAEGVAAKDAPQGDALVQAIDDYMWYPEYVEYRPA